MNVFERHKKLKGVTYTDITQNTGLSPSDIRKILKGDTLHNIDTIIKVCQYLDVTPEQAFKHFKKIIKKKGRK